jgi:hypothetical protein
MDLATKKCRTCGEVKPLDSFNKLVTGVLGRTSRCRDCAIQSRRKYTICVGEKECASCKQIKPAESFDKNQYKKDGLKRTCKECGKIKRYDDKRRVIAHYTNGSNKCACCGEAQFEFLTIDHIAGGGSKHRKEIRTYIIRHLIRNNFPPGYRILCFNCNCAKGFFGYCPHEKSYLSDGRRESESYGEKDVPPH